MQARGDLKIWICPELPYQTPIHFMNPKTKAYETFCRKWPNQ